MTISQKKILIRLTNGFFAPLVLGIGITLGGNWLWNELDGGVDHLNYTVEQTAGILRGLKEVNRGSKFYIDKNDINDFSILTINLFNDTGENFEDVPVKIILNCKRSDVLSMSHYDKAGDIDKSIPVEDTTNNDLRYTFTHSVVNSLGSKPVASMRLVLRGSNVPNFKIDTEYKGLELKVTEPSTDMLTSFHYWEGVVVGILIVTCLYLARRRREIQTASEKLEIRLRRTQSHLALYKQVYPNAFIVPPNG